MCGLFVDAEAPSGSLQAPDFSRAPRCRASPSDERYLLPFRRTLATYSEPDDQDRLSCGQNVGQIMGMGMEELVS